MTNDWTYGRKLGVGFAFLTLLAILMSLVAWFALTNVVREKDHVIEDIGQDLIDAEHLMATIQNKVARTRAYLITAEETHLEKAEVADADFLETLTRMRARSETAEERQLLDIIGSRHRLHAQGFNELMDRRLQADSVEGLESAFETRVQARLDELMVPVRTLVKNAEQARDRAQRASTASAETARMFLAGVAVFTVLSAILVSVYLTRLLSIQIGTSIQHIRSSAAELQAAATQQAAGAREQSSAMGEISTTLGELLATSRQIAESGQNVAKMASDSSKSAASGQVAVKRSWESVNAISQQVNSIVQHMLGLGKKSQQIGSVLDIINELSEQTNILAINATIEAAGAGEAGRRFSVVGDEIRKLSDRVGRSTKEIRELIEEVRTAVNTTVMATEAGSKVVEAGTVRFQELDEVFARIADIVVSTMEAGREIELSTKQQATAVEQVNIAIANVTQATKETEASTNQTLQTSSQLSSLSNDLSRFVQHQSA
jgi:methyl-accepting chemotaxis protein